MSMDFHVQLLIKSQGNDQESVVGLPWLGNSSVRRAISPLMETHEFHGEQCVPSHGEMPFHVDSPAFNSIQLLAQELLCEIATAYEERDHFHENPEEGDWSVPHRYLTNAEPFYELLVNSLDAAKSVQGNPYCSIRIVWC